MSAAAFPSSTKLGAEWYKAPIDYEEWKRAARRCWKFFKRRSRQKRREFEVKDREIGREIGASRRTVQRGLWWLEKVYGVIFRDHSDGHGRVVKILLPLAGDDNGEAKESKAKAKAKPSSAARPAAPATPPGRPADPPGDPDPDPCRPIPPGGFMAEIARLAAQLGAESPAEEPRPAPPPLPSKPLPGIPDDIGYLAFKEKTGETLSKSERKRLDEARGDRAP